jgi:hypothetical protein
MSHDYTLPGSFTLADIKGVLKLAEECFGQERFIGFPNKEKGLALLTLKGPLAFLKSLKDLPVFDLSLNASFESAGFPLEIFEIILESLKPDFGLNGDVSVVCKIQRPDEGYAKKWRDPIGVEIRNGKLYFYYAALSCGFDKNIQKQDVRQAEKDALARVIKIADLPAVIVTTDGKYFLEPTIPGAKWHLTENPPVMIIQNPSSIKCELPGVTVGGVLDRVKSVMMHLQAEEIKIASKWELHPYSKRSADALAQAWPEAVSAASQKSARRLLQTLAEKTFPAQKIWMMFWYHLRQLEEIENLREICQSAILKRDEGFLTQLCTFSLPDREVCAISISTTSKGHELSVDLTSRKSVSVIEEKLGFKLKGGKSWEP